ncbi:MAG: ribonuclease HII [Desulfovibrionaceae bacterium]
MLGPDTGLVAGTDEAGRGCLAGPVVAAAVILPPVFDLPGLTDSKKLTEARRNTLRTAILAQATAWNLGLVWPWTIDRINILQASLAAMRGAVARLGAQPCLVLVDGNQTIPGLGIAQRTVVGGDALEPAISAASILAKTFRDDIMRRLDTRYPAYGFAGHKGYGAKTHMAALREHGPCRMHRMTFRGVLPEPHKEHDLWLPGI